MDELYVIARRVLLDALEALGPHRDATVLVGAQAIYLHTGAAELAVAEFTTDADIALDPDLLEEIPPLERALEAAGFVPMGKHGVGIWQTCSHDGNANDVEVAVDLLVPSSVSPGAGRRAARLPGHDEYAARKVDGLEGALIDKVQMEIASLEPDRDSRRILAWVAGPGALLVSKLFKISERRGTERANDKDALDVFRILRGVETESLAVCMAKMRGDQRASDASARAIGLLDELFGTRASDGASMVARATRPLMDEHEVRESCALLATELLSAIEQAGD